jgi:hypothetical protein
MTEPVPDTDAFADARDRITWQNQAVREALAAQHERIRAELLDSIQHWDKEGWADAVAALRNFDQQLRCMFEAGSETTATISTSSNTREAVREALAAQRRAGREYLASYQAIAAGLQALIPPYREVTTTLDVAAILDAVADGLPGADSERNTP